MEESELHEVLRSTMANPDSTAYKSLIQSIFTQSVALPAADFAYDNDFYRVCSKFLFAYYCSLFLIICVQCKKPKIKSNGISFNRFNTIAFGTSTAPCLLL